MVLWLHGQHGSELGCPHVWNQGPVCEMELSKGSSFMYDLLLHKLPSVKNTGSEGNISQSVYQLWASLIVFVKYGPLRLSKKKKKTINLRALHKDHKIHTFSIKDVGNNGRPSIGKRLPFYQELQTQVCYVTLFIIVSHVYHTICKYNGGNSMT